jgi:hypothetical protein
MAAPVPSGGDDLGYAAAAPPAGDTASAATLRNIRADVQSLQDALARVRVGESDLKDPAEYIARKARAISAALALVTGDDSVQRLRNIWEQMVDNPILQTPTAPLPGQALIRNLDFLDEQCRQFIVQVGIITIPGRLVSWLSKARPGYYIPFHTVFADEIPRADDRESVLRFLAIQPPAGALIDVDAGLIYRYATTSWERVVSIALLVLALLLAGALIVGICFLPIHGVPEWTLDPTSAIPLLIAWLAILVGVLIHIAVSLNKRLRESGQRPPVLAVSDLPLVINAYSGQILLKLVLTLVALFGLAFSVPAGQLSPPVAFLVGYSLDSFVELVTSQVQQQSSAQLETLQQLRTGDSAAG